MENNLDNSRVTWMLKPTPLHLVMTGIAKAFVNMKLFRSNVEEKLAKLEAQQVAHAHEVSKLTAMIAEHDATFARLRVVVKDLKDRKACSCGATITPTTEVVAPTPVVAIAPKNTTRTKEATPCAEDALANIPMEEAHREGLNVILTKLKQAPKDETILDKLRKGDYLNVGMTEEQYEADLESASNNPEDAEDANATTTTSKAKKPAKRVKKHTSDDTTTTSTSEDPSKTTAPTGTPTIAEVEELLSTW